MKESAEAFVIATLSDIVREVLTPLFTNGFKHFGKKHHRLLNTKGRKLKNKIVNRLK